MKKLGFKVISASILSMMLITGVSYSGKVASAENAKDVEKIFAMSRSNSFAYVDGKVPRKVKKEAEKLPDSYDLRHVPDGDGGEISYVTPVKLQNPYGTCWGFAAAAAAESSLLSSGIAEKAGYDENTLDLSEKHIAYFATSKIEDKTDSQYGEGMHFQSLTDDEKKSGSYRYNTGGLNVMATAVFASGIGPLVEKKADSKYQSFMEKILSYKGKNAERVYREVATEYDDNGKPIETSYRQMPVWYSDQDDWSIPEYMRYYQSFRLKDTLVLPCPAQVDEEGNYEYHQEGVEAIKQQVSKEHRAVSIDFTAESYLPGQDTSDKLYMSDKWAHFTNVFNYSNHAVTIVGYDDNYPKENFNSTTSNGGSAMPEGDGAFLVKNSWGSELNEFPNNGHRHWGILAGQDKVPYDKDAKADEGNKASGYFWISYYDRSLYDPEVFIFDSVTGENGYYAEQKDLMSPNFFMEGYKDGAKMANTFEAEATSELKSISVMTTRPETKVFYEVYLLGDDFYDPEDGILIETGEKTYKYGGYHKIDLKATKILTRGQKYSVVVKETVNNKDYITIPTQYNQESCNYIYKSVINEKESYHFDDIGWSDLSDSSEELKKELSPDYAEMMVIDNFPIKSYLEPVYYNDGKKDVVFDGYLNINNWQEGNAGKYELLTGKSKTLAGEIRGLTSDMPDSWNPVISWESTDESIVKISTDKSNSGTAKIIGLQPGVANVIVYAGDKNYKGSNKYPDNYGVRVLSITVRNPNIGGFVLQDPEFNASYTGAEIKPPIEGVFSEDGKMNLTEGKDYIVSYENNIDAGKATITVSGVGDYDGSMSQSFTINPAENTCKAEAKNIEVTYSKAQQIIELKNYIDLKNEGQGAKNYIKVKGNDNINIYASTGNINLEGGLDVGTYELEVDVNALGDANYKPSSQTVKFSITVKHISNTLNVVGSDIKLKHKKLAKKKKKIELSEVISTYDEGQGEKTYSLESTSSKIKLTKKGKIKVKKGIKKGKYNVKISVTAAGDKNTASVTKSVTVKFKIK